jgi:cytochrome c556
MYRILSSLVLGAMLVAVPVTADEAAEKAFQNAVKMTTARQGFMQLQSQQTAAMAAAAAGKAEITAEVVAAAQNLVNLSLMLPDVFGEGSGLDVIDFTRAVPELWVNVDERDNLIKRLAGQANRLIVTAESGNAAEFQNAFKQLTGTCKKCHETFRAKTAPRDM